MTKLIFLLCIQLVILKEINSREIKTGYEKYTTYKVGKLNIILTAPHGGSLKPDTIGNRNYSATCTDANGNCIWTTNCQRPSNSCVPVVEPDYNTQLLANTIANKFHKKTGKYPHLIQTELNRIKLDPNRDKPEATLNDKESIKAWTDFHNFIKEAKKSIDGIGLLLDIHGQSHPEKWVELSYYGTKAEINNVNLDPKQSSIYTLSKRFPDTNFTDLIYGNNSFGGLLEAKGVKTVPSPSHNRPGDGNYFQAYYITMEHGSKNGGNIDAIQVESPFKYRYNESTIEDYSDILTDVVLKFMEKYYKSNGSNGSNGVEKGLKFSIPLTCFFVLILKLLN